MELKLRENEKKEHQWYFEYWIEVDGDDERGRLQIADRGLSASV